MLSYQKDSTIEQTNLDVTCKQHVKPQSSSESRCLNENFLQSRYQINHCALMSYLSWSNFAQSISTEIACSNTTKMSTPLPHPHVFITCMISQLAKIDATSPTGLSSLRGQDLKSAKSIFATLHFLFPHELLPALDLLDRKLVTQLFFIPSRTAASNTPATRPLQSDDSVSTEQSLWEIFYVQSASAAAISSKSKSRYRRIYNPTGTHYEVRLDAWNCTCPAFSFSAFGGASDISHDQASPVDEVEQTRPWMEDGWAKGWRFGGTGTSYTTEAPICKHILAAVLGKALPNLFGSGVEKKEVTATEAAGWCAGWGD
jgi:hypothetical protein